MDHVKRALERALRAKSEHRIAARAQSWPEKVAVIERLRIASHQAKLGMRVRQDKK